MATDPFKDLTIFLHASFPSAIPSTLSEFDISHISHELYPKTSYTDSEKVEISTWLTSSSHLAAPGEDEAKHVERLGSLNRHLSTRTTLLGCKPSVADLAVYYRLYPLVKGWSKEERTGEKGYHHIVRHIDFVQNTPMFGLSLKPGERVDIDPDDVEFIHKPIDPKEEKERKKREKAAAVAAAAETAGAASKEAQTTLAMGKGKDKSTVQPEQEAKQNPAPGASTNGTVSAPTAKKEKKEKAPKQPKLPPASTPLSPHLIDLRVGHILKAIPHPDADSLYVSTIACGDAPGTENTSEHEGKIIVRTVCSGLNGLVPLVEMQGRKIVAVCNLKPVKMRGITSAAMVLAASPRLAPGEEEDHHHAGPVELVDPPEGAGAGERLCFEGWEGEPEGQLNPKKKIFETLQPGLTTDGEGRVTFDAQRVEALKGEGRPAGLLKTKGGGLCKVKSLKGAIVR
ncbi:MAG: hypothetical protein Q9217_002396 [Psora testacea]